ncbi:Hypothetical protein NTJ_06463 [Nesidiocoris tenuis]|uniref:Uncharacterized protein n=1 Tax=Nesidiocoris tenuis TaxID=355587 RepID=A0ABN7AN45_9HEMI|nr:Hypothetical protein NTJ_06463 [Nesidiocoris tenuis]
MSHRTDSKIGSVSKSVSRRSVSQTCKENASSRTSMRSQSIQELPVLVPIQLMARLTPEKKLSSFQSRQALSKEIIERLKYPGLEIERQRLTAGLNKLNESLPKISSWQNIESNSMTSTDANGSSNRQSRKSEERKLSSPKKLTGFQSGTPKSGKRLVRTSTKGARSNRITHDTKATSGAEMQEGETNLKKSKESKSSDTKKPHRKSKAKSISGRLPAKNEGKQSPKRDQRKSKSPTSEKPKKSSATKRSVAEKGRRSMRKSRENKSPDKAEVGQKSKRGSRRKSDRKSTSRERSPKKKRKGPPRPSDAKSTKSKKKSRASQASSKQKKGSGDKNAKKGKKVKEKVVKLNRKAIYKDLRNIEKTIAGENQKRQKLQWDKDKLYFYWNCAVGKLLEMNKTNSNLKKKLEKLNLEVKHALPGEYWKKMHQARLSREEKLQAKNEEFAAMIVQLRDAQKAKADSLFKAIQTEVNDTYLVGQRYLSDVIGIRKEYTENLTATLFEAREKMRVLEIEMNCKYAPILEEFEEEMKKMRNQVPKERQERYWD